MKLFVTGLPYDLDDAELEEIFEKFGTIISAKVAIDRETGKSRGFGFVDMANSAMAAFGTVSKLSTGIRRRREAAAPVMGSTNDPWQALRPDNVPSVHDSSFPGEAIWAAVTANANQIHAPVKRRARSVGTAASMAARHRLSGWHQAFRRSNRSHENTLDESPVSRRNHAT